MKKVIILFLAVFGFAANSTQAQDNVFKVNIFSPVVRTASVFYERTIAQDKSVQLGVFYTGFSADNLKVRGFGITPEFRKYMSARKEAPEGFYIAPFLRYQSLELSLDESEDFDMDEKATLNTIGGGMLIGGQWLFGERFILDAFIGPSYNAGKAKATAGANEDDFSEASSFSGFGVRSGVAIGLKF